MKDVLISLVRTLVTGWWGALVAYLAARGLLPAESVDLANNFLAAVVLPTVIAAVYAAVRVVETWLAALAAKGGVLGTVAKLLNVVLAGVPKVPAYA